MLPRQIDYNGLKVPDERVEYMTLEELQNELENDLVIDQTKLQYEAANNPVLYGKWVRKHSACRKKILSLETVKKQNLKRRLDYYTGRGDVGEVCMDQYERSEMKTVLSADKDILSVDTKIQYWNILLEFCSNSMDIIKSRGFSIKHIIDLRQFEAGA